MLDERGYEIPDNTPVAVPTRLRLPQNRTEQIRAYIRQELSRAQVERGHETFEEADDFSLPDGEQWVSPYEETFEPPVTESGSGGVPVGDGEAKPLGDPARPGEGAQPPAKLAGVKNEPQEPV